MSIPPPNKQGHFNARLWERGGKIFSTSLSVFQSVDQLLSTQYLLTPLLQRLHVQSIISGHIVEGQGQPA